MDQQSAMSAIPRAQLLIHAATVGDLEQCQLMIEDGEVDVNAADYNGRTPLHLALAEGLEQSYAVVTCYVTPCVLG